MIKLEPITEDNVFAVLALKAAEELVAPNSESLAEAYLSLKEAVDNNELHLNNMERPYAILKDETAVGFLMICYEDGEDVMSDDGNIYWLSRFMIDEKHQGRGYGKTALKMLIEFIKTKPNGNGAKSFYTSVVPESPVAAKLYANVGFVKTGQVLHGEEVMRLVL